MHLVFSNNQTVEIKLASTPLADVYQKIYKHLSRVPIQLRNGDNPYYSENMAHNQLVEKLVESGAKVGVTVDRDRCITQDQTYFNLIHKIYEQNYNGNTDWLDFHEHIHLCESSYNKFKILHIDYREKSGLLEKQMDPAWSAGATTKIHAGDVFVRWAELGKTPYGYWQNLEPNDINRMRELIKPWIKLRPKIQIALEDIDFLQNIQVSEFESWWKDYSVELCSHWQVPSWTVHDIFSVSVFGHVDDVKLIDHYLKNNILPTKVVL